MLPTALPGLVTGSLLAIARGAGETAPLLFTATLVTGTTFDLGTADELAARPDLQRRRAGQSALVERAWGAALTLVLMILMLTLLARFVSRRSRLA